MILYHSNRHLLQGRDDTQFFSVSQENLSSFLESQWLWEESSFVVCCISFWLYGLTHIWIERSLSGRSWESNDSSQKTEKSEGSAVQEELVQKTQAQLDTRRCSDILLHVLLATHTEQWCIIERRKIFPIDKLGLYDDHIHSPLTSMQCTLLSVLFITESR